MTRLSHAKLSPPRIAVRVIERPRLDRLIFPPDGAGAASSALVLVDAPPGFGKSTLLAQWRRGLEARGIAAAWLSLDEDDQAAAPFLDYLWAAFAQAGVEPPAVAGSVRDQPVKARLVVLLGEIERLGHPVALMLDDYHRLKPGPVDELMNFLLARLPANLMLVIAGRGRPRLKVERLRAQGLVQLIGADDLRFSADEVAAYFGGGLPEGSARLLAARTAGWPAAVELARLWLAGQGGSHTEGSAEPYSLPLIERFSGRSTDLAAYMAEQVFLGLDPGIKDFLLKTAILERVDGELAKHLTGREDAWLVLENLGAIGLPVTAASDRQADDRLGAYRYHQLFTEFLRDRLAKSPDIDAKELHRRAAAWYAGEHRFFEAARHAAEAGEAAYAARLLDEAGGWRAVLKGGLSILLKFRDLAPTMLRQYPHLRLAQIYLMAREGEVRAARQAYLELERETNHFQLARGRDWNPLLELESRLVGVSLDIYEGRPVRLDEMDRLALALESLPRPDPSFAGMIEHMKVIAYYDAGNFEAAAEAAAHGAEDWQAAGNVPLANYLYLYRGRALYGLGRVAEAEAAYGDSLDLMAGFFQDASISGAVAPLFLAELHYERGDIKAARKLLNQAFARVIAVESWFDLEVAAYRTAALIALRTEGPAAALAVTQRAAGIARQRGLDLTGRFLDALKLELMVRAGDLKAAGELAASPDFLALIKDEPDDPWGWRIADPARVALARYHLAAGAGLKALSLLTGFKERLAARGHQRRRLDVLILEAGAAFARGSKADALAAFGQALDVAAGQGLMSPFLALGHDLEALVRLYEACPSHQAAAGRFDAFLARLLDQLAQRETLTSESATVVEAPLRDGAGGGAGETSLSPRERQVLELIAAGLSGKEIAARLDLAESTVKTHRKNLYSKLDVHRRSAALAKTRLAPKID